MGILVQWLASLFGGLVSFFSAFIAKRVAIGLAIVSAFVALTVGMLAAIKALLSGLTFAIPGYSTFVPCFVPSGVSYNFAIIASAYLIRWAYDYHVKALELQASAS